MQELGIIRTLAYIRFISPHSSRTWIQTGMFSYRINRNMLLMAIISAKKIPLNTIFNGIFKLWNLCGMKLSLNRFREPL